MFNKKMIRSTMALGIIVTMSITGCGKETVKNEGNVMSTAEAGSEQKNNSNIEKLTYEDYSKFTKLQDFKIPCEFQNTFNPEHFEDDYEITGSYDLNRDGTEDKITFRCNKDTMDMELTINDASIKQALPDPEDAYLVDLDPSDSYINLVLYDGGMSADPYYLFFQYDGQNITELGGVRTYFEDCIGLDGHNRAIAMDSFLEKLEPAILPGYYEMADHEWKYHEFDLSKVEGKEYTISEDIEAAYFRETDMDVKDFQGTWEESEKISLQAGDKVIINKIGEYEQYQVKLADGRVGILYFWIGD